MEWSEPTRYQVRARDLRVEVNEPDGVGLFPTARWWGEFERWNEPLLPVSGSAAVIYPCNGSIWKGWFSDRGPFDVAGVQYIPLVYVGCLDSPGSTPNVIAIDLDSNNHISSTEIFRMGELGIVDIPGYWMWGERVPPLGNYRFRASFRIIGDKGRLISEVLTWMQGTITLNENSIELVLCPMLTDVRSHDTVDGAVYGYSAVNFASVYFDLNRDGRYERGEEGPFFDGDCFMCSNISYQVEFGDPDLAFVTFPSYVAVISPTELFMKSYRARLCETCNVTTLRNILILGNSAMVPFQRCRSPFTNYTSLWSDEPYSRLSNDSIRLGVGRIDVNTASEALLAYVRSREYMESRVSSQGSLRALFAQAGMPPYPRSELEAAGYDTFLVSLIGGDGNVGWNASSKSIWDAQCQSDLVLYSGDQGLLNVFFSYAEPKFLKPCVVVWWACSSAFAQPQESFAGYKSLLSMGAVAFIGTVTYMISSTSPECELLHTMLDLALREGLTIGESFSIARDYLDLRITEFLRSDTIPGIPGREIWGPDYVASYERARRVAMFGSVLYGDPALVLKSEKNGPAGVSTIISDPYWVILNERDRQVDVTIGITILNEPLWERYWMTWCGPRSRCVSFLWIEGTTVAAEDKPVPLGPSEGGEASILYPTVLIRYVAPWKWKLSSTMVPAYMCANYIPSYFATPSFIEPLERRAGNKIVYLLHVPLLSYNREEGTVALYERNLPVILRFTYSAELASHIEIDGLPIRIGKGLSVALCGRITPAPANGVVNIMGTDQRGTTFSKEVPIASNGTFSISFTLSAIGRWTIALVYLGDAAHLGCNTTEYVVCDEIVVRLSAPTRVALGDPVRVNVTAWYASDSTPFQGEIQLNNPNPFDSQNVTQPQKVSYEVVRVIDHLYNISCFQSNTVDVVFDKLDVSSLVDSSAIGVARVRVLVKYAFDSSPVEGAMVYVDGNAATYEGRGGFEYRIETYSPILIVEVDVRDITQYKSREAVVHVANTGVLMIASLALMIVLVGAILFRRFRRSRS